MLAYRAFSFWLPTLPGAVAYFQLRRTIAAGRPTTPGQPLRDDVSATRFNGPILSEVTDNAYENVVIVGSGPAGYTAALYTARANLEPLVVEGFAWGGLLQQTTDVENFPGFPAGDHGTRADAADARPGGAVRRATGDRRGHGRRAVA